MNVSVVQNALVVVPDKQQVGRPLLDLLTTELLLPAGFARDLFRDNRVVIGKEHPSAATEVVAGQKIWLHGGIQEEPRFNAIPDSDQDLPVNVLFEDDHALIVNKPAGMLVYPGEAEDVDTLANRVATYYLDQGVHRAVRHVHRLDRDTTGAVLYAKHAYSARAFDTLMARRGIHRRYIALVRGKPSPANGTIAAAIGRDRHVSGRYRVSSTGKMAVTHYWTRHTQRIGNDSVSLVECELETGRTHQIRVHMAHLGCPVVGDALYGAGRGIGSVKWLKGHALHARSLAFTHPYDKAAVEVTAPLPPTFQAALDELEMCVETDILPNW